MKRSLYAALTLTLPIISACGPKLHEIGGIKTVHCDTRKGEDAYRHDPTISHSKRQAYQVLGDKSPVDMYKITLDGFVYWKSNAKDGQCSFTLRRGTQFTRVETDASLCSSLSTPQDPPGATHLLVSLIQHPQRNYVGYSNCSGSGVQQTYRVSSEQIKVIEHRADTSSLPDSYKRQ